MNGANLINLRTNCVESDGHLRTGGANRRRFCVEWAILAGFLLTAATLAAQPKAIFPDMVGAYTRSAPKTVGIPDQPLYEEYGLEASESAEYDKPATTEGADKGPKKHFSATAWRMKDSTGAFALWQLRRPSGATKSTLTPLAVTTSDGTIFTYGNYVFQFTGDLPETVVLNAIFAQLPRLENSALPFISNALPTEGMVPNSERYILGPVSLQRFEPGIPPSTAAFRMGAEAQLARYTTPKGTMDLVMFAYPAPAMAREQAVEFQKIPGAMVKRTGPWILAILSPPDADAAERLLAKLNYQATITINENVPKDEVKGFATKVVNMMAMAGILGAFSIMLGVGFGWFRIFRRRVLKREGSDAMITLHLDPNARNNKPL